MNTLLRPRLKLVFLIVFLLAALPLAVNAQVPTPSEDTMVIALPTEPNELDPSQASGANYLLSHMFMQLYELGQASGKIEPFLAHSYEISEDGTEWTFFLNEGLTCHDGAPLTADDVAYSFERAADPANGFTGNTAGFVLPSIGYKGIKADGDYAVTIMMEKPQNETLRLGLIAEVYILCRESYEGKSRDEAARDVIGNGPYRFAEWVPGEYIRMERVEDFPLRETYFKNLIWRFIPEPSTMAAEMIAGNVDLIKGLTPAQADAIRASGVAEVRVYESTVRYYVGFSMIPGLPFSDTKGGQAILKPEVRVALQYAVDVPTICESLLGAPCVRANGPVNAPNNHPDLPPYPYDPAKAEELLDAAGYPRDENGVRFELQLQARRITGPIGEEVSLAIAQYLSDIGVKTEVEFLENNEFRTLVLDHKAGPLYILGTGGSTWSAQYDMADFTSPKGRTNYIEWSNMGWFDRWDKLATMTDPDEIRKTELEMLEIFYNDPPWLMLYSGPVLEAVSNRLDFTSRRDFFIIAYDAKLKS